MIQKGIVKSTEGEYAIVEVMRTSACVGCSQQDGCIACKKKIESKAYNPIGARAGDLVTLETPSDKVLLFAFLVFVLPLALTIGAYFVSSLISTLLWLQISVSACIFIVSYVIIYFMFDRTPQVKNAVEIISKEN